MFELGNNLREARQRRRIDLVAAEQDTKEAAPKDTATLQRFLPPALCLAVPLIALGLYLRIGHPGLPAAPFVAGAHPPASAPQDDLFVKFCTYFDFNFLPPLRFILHSPLRVLSTRERNFRVARRFACA